MYQMSLHYPHTFIFITLTPACNFSPALLSLFTVSSSASSPDQHKGKPYYLIHVSSIERHRRESLCMHIIIQTPNKLNIKPASDNFVHKKFKILLLYGD